MMKKISLLAILLAFSVILQAQNDVIRAPRPKVGVVLGGGGAKGASHIGVLKYIEELGIPIDYVAGTSMGSIIGGLYAMGYSPDELTELIAGMDWSQYIGNKIDRSSMSKEARWRNSSLLINLPFSLQSLLDKDSQTTFVSQLPSAYVNNSSLVNLFNDLCVGYQEEMSFNDLPIPFACVATDMITGDEVVLRSGSIPTAMRASMAIPGVFSPVKIGDMVLVDGGLVNNFPADVLREMGADIIIGIEITSTKDVTAEDLQSLPQLLGRLVTNTTSGKREENRKMCNIYIVPDVSGFGMLSFNPEAIDTLVERGYKTAVGFHDQLMRVKNAVESYVGHPVGKVLHAPKAKNIAVDSVLVRSITINNVPESVHRWLIRKGGLKVGQVYTQNNIENTMKVFRGTGCFDEITYQVKESDSLHQDRMLEGFYDLTVNMKPAKPHVVGLGLRYDTEEGAALLLNLGLNAKKFGGSKLDFSVKLSYNPKVNLTYTYSKSSLANFSAAYDYRNEHFSVMIGDRKSLNLRYHLHQFSGYISQFHLLNFSTSVGLSYNSYSYDLVSVEENSYYESLVRDDRMLAPFFHVTYDNLDHSYFAKHGVLTQLTSRFYYEPKLKNKFFDVNYAFQGYITPGDGRFTVIPQLYGRFALVPNNVNAPLNLMNLYGSEISGRHIDGQMPFIGISSIDADASRNTTILRCDLRYNFYGKHYLTAMYNLKTDWDMLSYATFSDMLSSIHHGAGLKYSYNSALGPISLTGHWVNMYGKNRFGAYFSFGYTF